MKIQTRPNRLLHGTIGFLVGTVILTTCQVTQAALWTAPTNMNRAKRFLLQDDALVNQDAIGRNESLLSYRMNEDTRAWSSSFLPARLGYSAWPLGRAYTMNIAFGSLDRNYADYLGRRQRAQTTPPSNELLFLAPSEKYDLVFGLQGQDESLTHRLWLQAKDVDDKNGINTWTGMCHGWSPAATAIARPKKTVWVQGVTGTWVPFSPDDIKMLASTLFANSYLSTESRETHYNSNSMPIIFGRCRSMFPARDETGRVIYNANDPGCYDKDPALFHAIVVNLLGIQKRSFVMDRVLSHKVDNHPVWGYEMRYFNPSSGRYATYENSKILKSRFRNDVRSWSRLPQTHTIVGVEMKLFYASHKPPSTHPVDSVAFDKSDDITILYDLELSETGEILGGEWRDSYRNHDRGLWAREGYSPERNYLDFLWYVPSGLKAWSRAEPTSSWIRGQIIPSDWTERARNAALATKNLRDSRGNPRTDLSPQPLGTFIYQLVDLARE